MKNLSFNFLDPIYELIMRTRFVQTKQIYILTRITSLPFQNYPIMVQDIRDNYLSAPDGKITQDTVSGFAELMYDTWVNYGVDYSIKAQVKRSTGNVFYYLFSLDTKLNGYKRTFPDYPGVTHGDDLFYVFKMALVTFEDRFFVN